MPYVFGSLGLGQNGRNSVRGGNNEWLWRTIDIPAAYILEKGDPTLILIGEFMHEECKKLFHA